MDGWVQTAPFFTENFFCFLKNTLAWRGDVLYKLSLSGSIAWLCSSIAVTLVVIYGLFGSSWMYEFRFIDTRIILLHHSAAILSFCVILCHFVSFCVILCHFVSFCVILCHFVSFCDNNIRRFFKEIDTNSSRSKLKRLSQEHHYSVLISEGQAKYVSFDKR